MGSSASDVGRSPGSNNVGVDSCAVCCSSSSLTSGSTAAEASSLPGAGAEAPAGSEGAGLWISS
eukprot:5007738-Lingulodinium_polyedra.AAC.1